MVFPAFALASLALSPTAQGQLPSSHQASAARHVHLLERPSVVVQPSRQRSGNQHKQRKLRWRALDVRWSDIEVTPNNYTWQYLDDAVALAATNNKTCGISINAGKDCPEWLYAPPYNAQSYTLVDTVVVDQIPVGAKIPVPGDSMFMTRWQKFITDFGARYDHNPAVSYAIIDRYR